MNTSITAIIINFLILLAGYCFGEMKGLGISAIILIFIHLIPPSPNSTGTFEVKK